VHRKVLPQGGNDTSEATEEHRRGEMHGLVRLLCISLRRLARAQERKERAVKLGVHELRDRQLTVAQAEAALQRVPQARTTLRWAFSANADRTAASSSTSSSCSMPGTVVVFA
jgi:hypothetical protein